MAAPNKIQKTEPIPLALVGGNKFGRYNKISTEQTWNFIVSDDWLVPYAGYKNVVTLNPSSQGRGLYASTVGNIMIVVIGSEVYSLGTSLVPGSPVGDLETASGDVYIAENNNFEICLTDGAKVYVYDYKNNIFKSNGTIGGVTFPDGFDPGFVSFHNGRFIVACPNTQTWWLSQLNDGTMFKTDAQSQGTIQTKPCNIQAVVPVPGQGNNVLVFGTNVAESWQDVALALFPYQKASTFNIDYGCLNPASLATLENFVVWLSFNEQSGPELSYTTGGPVQNISTDGISFKFGELKYPEDCTGFLFRQDGHVIYQFTFPKDNLTYAYDFDTKLFFTITDENLNYHPARQVVFFNNTNYFVSLEGGNVYEFATKYTTANYGPGQEYIIPRIRVCPPVRLPSQRYYINQSLGFTIENGLPNTVTVDSIPNFSGNDNYFVTQDGDFLVYQDGNFMVGQDEIDYVNYSSAVDLSISRDGGQSFGNAVRLPMNPTGQFRSRFIYQRLGIANDSSYQLKFFGYQRFVLTNGEITVSQ